MIVAGLGLSSRASVAEIVEAVRATMERFGVAFGDLGLVASIEKKRESPALAAAAHELGAPLVFVEPARLEVAATDVPTRSERSLALTGLPSVSETAALGVAGGGGRLLGARTKFGPVTCALAETGPTWTENPGNSEE